jgi:thiol-disulfide isomerase/thioredoxin
MRRRPAPGKTNPLYYCGLTLDEVREYHGVRIDVQEKQGVRVKHYFYLLTIIFWAHADGVNAAPTGPAVGSIAPDFKARNLVTGEDTTLSSQHGKVVILTFWASWCAPCKRELPILENAQRAVGKDKLVVFAVSHNDKPEALAAIKRPAAHWQINVMTDGNDHVARLYAVSGIPHLFLIGRDGKVVANHVGYGDRTVDELIADINRALAEPLPEQIAR